MTLATAHAITAARLRIPMGRAVSLASFKTEPIADTSSVFVPKLFTTSTAAGPNTSSCPVILPKWDIGRKASRTRSPPGCRSV